MWLCQVTLDLPCILTTNLIFVSGYAWGEAAYYANSVVNFFGEMRKEESEVHV